jgi:hypothetical protein
MKQFLRSACVALFAIAASSVVQADCTHFECTSGPDWSHCWERIGSDARRFPLATSCTEMCDCMPDIGSGELYCHCYCSLNYCYSA